MNFDRVSLVSLSLAFNKFKCGPCPCIFRHTFEPHDALCCCWCCGCGAVHWEGYWNGTWNVSMQKQSWLGSGGKLEATNMITIHWSNNRHCFAFRKYHFHQFRRLFLRRVCSFFFSVFVSLHSLASLSLLSNGLYFLFFFSLQLEHFYGRNNSQQQIGWWANGMLFRLAFIIAIILKWNVHHAIFDPI